MAVYLPGLIPAILVAAGLLSFLWRHRMSRFGAHVPQIAALTAFVVAGTVAARLAIGSAHTLTIFSIDRTAIALRVDVISVVMVLLVSFIGWVVTRYAAVYLDGEKRQGAFNGWLLLTLGAVTALVLAGDLVTLIAAWIATSLFLHRLLLFYPQRANARRAARKKFLTARLSDAALIGTAGLLVAAFGTTDIAEILAAARTEPEGHLPVAAACLLAIAAAVKSAQFPTHGWLTEVMETPTPVSALLHAGVINAGGFLLVRFADVLVLSNAALAGLVIVGGLTALFGSIVMLTQSAVKTSLAWSTVAQMGFMILECGLGLFPLALLHILAHSLYKAHSFLASGGAVERIAAARRLGPVAVPSPAAVWRAFFAALAIYVIVGAILGFTEKPPQTIALGAILIFGVAYLFAQGFADAAPRALTKRTAAYAVATSLGYFILQSLATWFTAGVLPPPPAPGMAEWLLIGLAVCSFAAVALLQGMLPLWANHPAVAGLRVHISNGLYLNAIFDRLIGGWNVRKHG